MKIKAIFLIIFCLLFSLAEAKKYHRSYKPIEGRVFKVFDGDTIELKTKNYRNVRIRLYGIDAPEIPKDLFSGQPYGIESKALLQSKILFKNVTVKPIDKDRYSRIVGIVFFNDTDINKEMIELGYAWAYRDYLDGSYATDYIKAEHYAKSQKKGLWHQKNPTPPWEYRKKERIFDNFWHFWK